MVDKLTDFSEKSFKNYTMDTEFKSKNLIFGYNGRGKTSLSKGVVDAFERSGGSSEEIAHFDKDYISRNLMLEERESSVIKGVTVAFGEKDINIEEEIQSLRGDIVAENALKDDIVNFKNGIRASIDTKHRERKGRLNISIKASNKSVQEVIRLYDRDIEDAKKIQGNEEFIRTQQGDDRLEKEVMYLDAMNIPNFNVSNFSAESLIRVEEILKTEYLDNNIPSTQIVKWLNQGLVLHEHEVNCNFCHNKIDYMEIKERINVYNEDVKQKDSKYIMDIIYLFKDWLKFIGSESFIRDRNRISNYFKSDVTLFKELDAGIIFIREFIARLEQKISDMDKADIEPTEELVRVLEAINDEKMHIDSLRSVKMESLRVQNDNLSKLVKGAIGLAIRDDESIQSGIQELQAREKRLEEIIANNKEINEKIRILENKGSGHGDFMIFLNGVLEDLHIDMKLIPHTSGKNYTLIHSRMSDISLTMKEISEGEKNLLALLFFYYQLYKDDRQESFNDIFKILIIDDPISSLDDANRFYVLEMMKNILTDTNVSAQVFILTHVWDDFCSLSFGLRVSKDDPYALFEVFKNTNSHSEVRKAQPNLSPYRKLFKEIVELSEKDINDINDCDIYHAPNSMRRIFEEFLRFKSGTDIIPTKRQQRKVESIIIKSTDGKMINEELCTSGRYLTSSKKTKLGVLLTITNVLSHNARHDTTGIHQSAKFMMSLIRDMDSAHYWAMKN